MCFCPWWRSGRFLGALNFYEGWLVLGLRADQFVGPWIPGVLKKTEKVPRYGIGSRTSFIFLFIILRFDQCWISSFDFYFANFTRKSKMLRSRWLLFCCFLGTSLLDGCCDLRMGFQKKSRLMIGQKLGCPRPIRRWDWKPQKAFIFGRSHYIDRKPTGNVFVEFCSASWAGIKEKCCGKQEKQPHFLDYAIVKGHTKEIVRVWLKFSFYRGTTLDCIIWSLVDTRKSATSGFGFDHIRV